MFFPGCCVLGVRIWGLGFSRICRGVSSFERGVQRSITSLRLRFRV